MCASRMKGGSVPLVHVHEVRGGGPVMSDDDVKVTAALVDHPPVVPAPLDDRLPADASPNARARRRRLAQLAGVKTLVLSHFVPPDDSEVTDQTWIAAARIHFRGTVVVGKDLLEV
jgi:hypothetical protein